MTDSLISPPRPSSVHRTTKRRKLLARSALAKIALARIRSSCARTRSASIVVGCHYVPRMGHGGRWFLARNLPNSSASRNVHNTDQRRGRTTSQPVNKVRGEEVFEGRELMRKRPSIATSYCQLAQFGATMRVWKRRRGALADFFCGSKLTAISFLSGWI